MCGAPGNDGKVGELGRAGEGVAAVGDAVHGTFGTVSQAVVGCEDGCGEVEEGCAGVGDAVEAVGDGGGGADLVPRGSKFPKALRLVVDRL